MEEEIAQLQDLITQLRAENQQMRQEQEAHQPGPSITSACSLLSSCPSNGETELSAQGQEVPTV